MSLSFLLSKYCRKVLPSEQGARTLQTDGRRTDGRPVPWGERNVA